MKEKYKQRLREERSFFPFHVYKNNKALFVFSSFSLIAENYSNEQKPSILNTFETFNEIFRKPDNW